MSFVDQTFMCRQNNKPGKNGHFRRFGITQWQKFHPLIQLDIGPGKMSIMPFFNTLISKAMSEKSLLGLKCFYFF